LTACNDGGERHERGRINVVGIGLPVAGQQAPVLVVGSNDGQKREAGGR
jgi:hypothetical protein